MEKKKRDKMLPKRFNEEDIKNWQNEANKTTGGNPDILGRYMLEQLNVNFDFEQFKNK
jgi:hypothetical protein